MEVPEFAKKHLEKRVTRARQSKEGGDETGKKKYIDEYDSLRDSTGKVYDNLDNIKYLDEEIEKLKLSVT